MFRSNKSRDRKATYWAVFAACVSLAGCGSDGDQVELLRLGLLVSTTGPSAGRGLDQLNAASLAAEEINDAGGVLGRELRLVHGDDGSDVGRLPGVIDGIVSQIDVPIVIGPVDSDIAVEAGQLLDTSTLLLSASASSDVGSPSNLHCLCGSDEAQGGFLAEVAREAGASTVALLAPDSAIDFVLTSAFADRFVELGGAVVSTSRYRPGRDEYTSVIRPVGSVSPDAILVDGHVSDAAAIVNRYLTLFPGDDPVWLFTDKLESVGFVTAVGVSFAFDHVGTGPSTTVEGYADFVARYQARYGATPAPGSHAAAAYDAVYLAALSLVAAGTTDLDALRVTLSEVAQGGTPYGAAEFEQALAAITLGEDIDYVGASGEVELGLDIHEVATFETWHVQGGQVVTDPSEP